MGEVRTHAWNDNFILQKNCLPSFLFTYESISLRFHFNRKLFKKQRLLRRNWWLKFKVSSTSIYVGKVDGSAKQKDALSIPSTARQKQHKSNRGMMLPPVVAVPTKPQYQKNMKKLSLVKAQPSILNQLTVKNKKQFKHKIMWKKHHVHPKALFSKWPKPGFVPICVEPLGKIHTLSLKVKKHVKTSLKQIRL